MTVVALVDQRPGHPGDRHRALDGGIVAIEHLGAVAGADDPIALLEIGDPLGQRRQRQRVGAKIGLAVAIAHHQRRAEPRADQHVGVIAEQDRQRKGAVEPRQDFAHRLGRGEPRLDLLAHQMRNHLGIGLTGEDPTARDKFLAQRLEILDNSIVDHCDVIGRVRVRIVGRRAAVGRPAGMRDPDRAGQRIGGKLARQIDQFPRGAATIDHPVVNGGDPGGIIAAIFQPPQPVEQSLRHVFLAQNAYDAAHETPRSSRVCRECGPPASSPESLWYYALPGSPH